MLTSEPWLRMSIGPDEPWSFLSFNENPSICFQSSDCTSIFLQWLVLGGPIFLYCTFWCSTGHDSATWSFGDLRPAQWWASPDGSVDSLQTGTGSCLLFLNCPYNTWHIHMHKKTKLTSIMAHQMLPYGKM